MVLTIVGQVVVVMEQWLRILSSKTADNGSAAAVIIAIVNRRSGPSGPARPPLLA